MIVNYDEKRIIKDILKKRIEEYIGFVVSCVYI